MAAPVDPRIQLLLRDAAWWRLIGRLFECPDPEWRTDISTLARELDDAELCVAVAAALAEATEGQYHSVFGPGGPAPPREASYHDTIELGSMMSSIATYYEAFAYRPATRETPDHVAVEAGFIAFLRLKEAFALADGDRDRASIAASAAERFRVDHLTMVAERIAGLLANSHLEYLRKTARLLADRVGPRPGPKRLTVFNEPFDGNESEFSCAEP
ncbi:MAG: molecular chaperone TorD family protein [Acidobacteriota bacterium]|nr:molecular chaperone TorD family protein [Acidobacteriota bacterium]